MDLFDDNSHATTRRAFLSGATAALAAGAASSWFDAVPAGAEQAAARVPGRTFYLSAEGSDAASGLSPQRAWKTLDRANRAILEPGDALLLRSGDAWQGQLHPQGSGAEHKPIVLSRYGSGGLPVIDMGAVKGAAVRLEDQSWWEIRELEARSGAPADPSIGRQGIAVLATGEGKTHHIVIRDCHIHDIWGTLGGRGQLDQYNSAAIFVGRPQAESIHSGWAHDVLIEGNRIERVDRCGVIANSVRKGLAIRGNRIENLGGDAIVPFDCDGVVVERNVIARSCQSTGNPDIWAPELLKQGMDFYNPHSAAMWLAGCNGGVMQFNEIYDTGRAAGNGDGESYDIDLGCRNCLMQYNLSRNNHGGLLLVMQQTTGNIARYNISENDQTHILALRPDLGDGNLIHNNVFYIDHGTAVVEMRDDERERKDTTKMGVPLRNNIFYATGEGRFRVSYLDPAVPDPSPGKDRLFLDNCYFGPWLGDGPNDSERAANTYDPLFLAPGQGGIGLDSLRGYQLRKDSPCRGRGIAIPRNGGRDFWGNPLPDGKLDIGAFQHRPG